MSRRIISKDGLRSQNGHHHSIRQNDGDHDTTSLNIGRHTNAPGSAPRSASKEKKVHGHHNSLFCGSATRRLLVVRYYLEKQHQSSRLSLLVYLVVGLVWMAATTSNGTILSSIASVIRPPAPIPRVDFEFHKPRVIEVSSNLSVIEISSVLRDPMIGFVNDTIEVSPEYERFKEELENSRKYKHGLRDPLRTEECEPMRQWQEISFPNCNRFHEMDLQKDIRVITNGGYNTVYRYTDMDGSYQILKILKYDTTHNDRNFDRVRRDSLIMERATASEYVMDIYSFCGLSQVVPLGRHGDLDNILWNYYDKLSQEQKLEIAVQITQGLVDVHDIDGDGISSMSHGDFAAKQYILIDGRFKLNDFNRGRFIRWNPTLKEPCPYHIGKNGDKFRAPEEYKLIPQTAAIDIWALGSVFVWIVTGQSIWHGYDSGEAQNHIMEGVKYPMDTSSTDPIDQVLFKAIDMCQVYEPKDRPKAGEVLAYLKGEAQRLGVEWDKKFGE